MFLSRNKFYIILLLLAAAIAIAAIVSEDEKQQDEFETYYKIYSLNIPDNLHFAGEQVPLADFDVKERYDRELLTNVYWQSQTLLMIKRSEKYFPVIEKILKNNSIPADFKYVALAESGLQPMVVSPANAASWWQFLAQTGKIFGLEINDEVDERYHLEKATEAACKYFQQAYKEFGSWALVAASYNMGIEGVKKQLQQQRVNSYYDLYLNQETARYVLRILAIKEVLEHKEKYGFNLVKNHLYENPPVVQVKVSKPIEDLAVFAKDLNCNYKQLKLLNPWLRKSSLLNKDAKTYTILLPKENVMKSSFANKIQEDTLVME